MAPQLGKQAGRSVLDSVRTPRLGLAPPFCLGVLWARPRPSPWSPCPYTFLAQCLVWRRMQREFLWSLAGRPGLIFSCPNPPLLSQAQGASLIASSYHAGALGLVLGHPFDTVKVSRGEAPKE